MYKQKEGMKIIFTNHALEQMADRGIFEEEVIDAIKWPLVTKKKHGKHFYLFRLGRGCIEVCCERQYLR